MERAILSNIQVSDYIHPMEKKVHIDEGSLIGKGIDALSDLNLAFVKRITLGCNVEATLNSFPRLIFILKDVCKILGYPYVPRVFITHAASQSFYAFGANKAQIILSDYIADQFTEDMFYFSFGNLISMIKAGHIRLATICSMMMATPQTELLKLPLQAMMRAADLTSDRGGLLAAQNFAAAAQCILWEAGIPISEMTGKNEQEMIQLSQEYVHASEWMSEEWLTGVAKGWKKLNMQIMPPAYRMRELLSWYKDGNYLELLKQTQEKRYIK